MELNVVQSAILDAVNGMGDKNHFTDAALSKKLREISKLDGKKKALISITDILAVVDELEKSGKIYSITITSANDLLIEKSEFKKEIPLEQKQRRLKHEKSQILFTASDFKNIKKHDVKHKKNDRTRTERCSIDVNQDFSLWDEDNN